MGRETILLKNWLFQTGDGSDCLKNGRAVTIPHTWNVEEGTEDYAGCGWYEHKLLVPVEWKKKRVRILFKAVYHDAEVYLNGTLIGRHLNSGFTPFQFELTEGLRYGGENTIWVKADNTYSEEMLPYMRSFDWANDGGIIRDVELLITGKQFIEEIRCNARPIILSYGKRQDAGSAVFGLEGRIDGEIGRETCLEWELAGSIYKGTMPVETDGSFQCSQIITHLDYWHFDRPSLYNVRLRLITGEGVADEREITTGFREFWAKGSRFCLNGEFVRICGTEWMPGSNPVYGMAEPKEQLEEMLRCLKESNSVYTRFHWQQDDTVLDWCDRHGLLVQEEVPFWGADPAAAGDTQWKVSRGQIAEMISAHRNHPSIIAWGVGNELDAQADDTIQYIKKAVAYVHSLDGSRHANYVSNSFYGDPAKDGTTDGDVLMINEYMGTWMQDKDVRAELGRVTGMNPDKPMVPSEFGLCEPAFSGGDSKRAEIFAEKMEIYREFPEIAGTIYFCLNDYRTQMGEEGEGKLRQRVHGSTDLAGGKKPSYWLVQKEYAPLGLEWQQDSIVFYCKNTLPSHEVKGYYGVLADDAGQELARIQIPDLQPGENWKCDAAGSELHLFRPNGDFAGSYRRKE